jgi:hypothetical protein
MRFRNAPCAGSLLFRNYLSRLLIYRSWAIDFCAPPLTVSCSDRAGPKSNAHTIYIYIYLSSVSVQGYIGEKHAMRPSSIKHDACAHAVTAPPCIIHVWMRWRKNWSTTKKQDATRERLHRSNQRSSQPSPNSKAMTREETRGEAWPLCRCGRLISSVSPFFPLPSDPLPLDSAVSAYAMPRLGNYPSQAK